MHSGAVSWCYFSNKRHSCIKCYRTKRPQFPRGILGMEIPFIYSRLKQWLLSGFQESRRVYVFVSTPVNQPQAGASSSAGCSQREYSSHCPESPVSYMMHVILYKTHPRTIVHTPCVHMTDEIPIEFDGCAQIRWRNTISSNRCSWIYGYLLSTMS